MLKRDVYAFAYGWYDTKSVLNIRALFFYSVCSVYNKHNDACYIACYLH